MVEHGLKEGVVHRLCGVMQSEGLKPVSHQGSVGDDKREGINLESRQRVGISQEVCRIGILASLGPEHPTPFLHSLANDNHAIANLHRPASSPRDDQGEERRCQLTRLMSLLDSLGKNLLASEFSRFPE